MKARSTRYEADRGSLHRAHLESLFLEILQQRLPSKVIAELDSEPMTREAVRRWASSHGINVPCVVEAYLWCCAGGWSQSPDLHIKSWTGPERTRRWDFLVLTGDQRPPQRVTNLEADELVFRWAVQQPPVEKASPASYWAAKGFPCQNTTSLVPRIALEAIARRRAPVACDPMRETREDFMRRAGEHWDARELDAKYLELTTAKDISEWRNRVRDLNWLIDTTLDHKSAEEIATGCGVRPDAVQKAAKRMGKVLGFPRIRGWRQANKVNASRRSTTR